MPSLLHEGLIALVRNQPAFAAELLTDLLHFELPRVSSARLADATLNEVVPTEYQADAVVLFGGDSPVFGAIVEVQLQRDDLKRYTWPYYAISARARHECPVVVIVIAPDTSTATWASERFDLGGGMLWRPYVIGPEGVPRVIDPAEAVRHPYLAILSAVSHGFGDPKTAAVIAAAAATAVRDLPEEQRLLYSLLIQSAMSDAARKEFQMLPLPEHFFNEEQRLTLAQGRAEGRARSLLDVLSKRRIAVSEAQQQHILACTDLATLDRWFDRAFTVESVEQLVG